MNRMEHTDTGKRRLPKAGAIALAAALAVGCVLSIAAGLPAQAYNFVAGGSATVMPGTGEAYFTMEGDAEGPVKAEDGRLWFEADGKKVDITDQVDEDTPYIYERTDPATGEKGYLVAGGTVEDYGWAEFFLTEDGTCSMMGMDAWEYFVRVDGERIPLSELSEAELGTLNENGGIPMDTVNRPWLDKAVAQLGLELELDLVNDMVDPLAQE